MNDSQLCALLMVFGAVAACGGKTADDGSGAGFGAKVGGGSVSSGGISSGGSISSGGISSGGSVSSGGSRSTGGSISSGGSISTGGSSIATGGSTVCGTVICTANSCGKMVDACGNVVDCGFNACDSCVCGTDRPNECPACTKRTCASAGNKDCGSIADGCGGIVDCGTCTAPQCCGCGGATLPASPNKCGEWPSAGVGLPQACLAGQQGCLCDSLGGCAPGLTCDLTRSPTVCCNGANCDLPANTYVGSTCTGTGSVPCTPGITIPAATGANDNCGYPSTSFDENQIICGFYATGGGAVPAQIQVFLNDEASITLGCRLNGYTVSPMPSNPGYVSYPSTGDPTCNDTFGRPLRPSLFITDITNDPSCTAGDQQKGGAPYDPVAIFGTWKATTDANPSAFNYWNLGDASDPIPESVRAQCPCDPPPAGVQLPDPTGYNGGDVGTYNNCPGADRQARGFGTETRYEASFIAGHSYRLQMIGHDGDQTQTGDTGEACVNFCVSGGSTDCVPFTCADLPPGTAGPQADGCGGLLDCGKPTCCVPWTCDQLCNPSGNASNTAECTSVSDGFVYLLECPQSDGCSGVLNCYCPLV